MLLIGSMDARESCGRCFDAVRLDFCPVRVYESFMSIALKRDAHALTYTDAAINHAARNPQSLPK